MHLLPENFSVSVRVVYAACTGEVTAMLHLDNKLVGQTASRPIGNSCWDQRFSFELDRVSHCVHAKQMYPSS